MSMKYYGSNSDTTDTIKIYTDDYKIGVWIVEDLIGPKPHGMGQKREIFIPAQDEKHMFSMANEIRGAI
jgi:hypothetical protein